ncbi:hypothetical protein [Lacunisphaera limnophila]|uniref:hypothetical protein n=1 Tax=Lacunisphaera limnophila TaxID=1838286 RepID=UPI0008597C75|nr:hypothetical protein [Lacunisphaera limnophila]
MSAEDDVPESVQSTLQAMAGKKEASYSLAGRVILFLVVAVVGSALAFGLFVRYAIGASMTAGAHGGGSALPMIIFLWLGGLVAAGVMIFKK